MTTLTSSYRSAGWAAIISAVFGLTAFGILQVGLFSMFTEKPEVVGFVILMFKIHHVGIILQSLFMIPVAFALRVLIRQRTPDASRATLAVGIVALSLLVLCALVWIANLVEDDYYMVPQGLVGMWLMVVNWKLSRPGSRALARFGMVVGFGLLLVGTFPIAYVLLVNPTGLHSFDPDPESTANTIIHNVLALGTLLGVLTYPVWTFLLGRRLLRESAA